MRIEAIKQSIVSCTCLPHVYQIIVCIERVNGYLIPEIYSLLLRCIPVRRTVQATGAARTPPPHAILSPMQSIIPNHNFLLDVIRLHNLADQRLATTAYLQPPSLPRNQSPVRITIDSIPRDKHQQVITFDPVHHAVLANVDAAIAVPAPLQ